VILAPDAGSMRKANSIAREMSLEPNKPLDIAFVQKERINTNISESGKIVGNIRNKTVVIYDDMVDTGGTLMQAAKIAKQAGTSKILACCTHAYMNSKPNAEKDFDQLLFESEIDELVVTNTRPFIFDRIKNSEKLRKKVTLLDISPYIAEAIRRDQHGYTITEMLKEIDKSGLYEVLFKKQ
jgi:ribose-phosphate pyrophosphokinase